MKITRRAATLGGLGLLATGSLSSRALALDGPLTDLIEGAEDFDESCVVDAIARTDYDRPVARQRSAPPAASPALPHEGGVFRRFLDGFRYR